MNNLRLDDHKLTFHVERLHHWLHGDKTYPIYMEISPSGTCNHRCHFCAVDFMGYTRRFLKADRMRDFFKEIGFFGVKAIMFAGEGEPLLHQDFARLVMDARGAGLDIGITTNASLLNARIAESILPYVAWIKASVDAGTSRTYSKLHGVKPGIFDAVIRNMAYCSELRQNMNLDINLGMQMLWLPENKDEVDRLADIAREAGMDYLVVKPYSQHPHSLSKLYSGVDYQQWGAQGDSFVIYRTKAMERWDSGEKTYETCYGLPFWAYLDAGGTLWGCSAHLQEAEFRYGNIYEHTFQDIWDKSKREYPAKNCRLNCRMEVCNQYLWNLKKGVKHGNFI